MKYRYVSGKYMHFMTANKKNLAFLQRTAKVGELFGLGTGGARLGEEVPLDSINTGATSIIFHAHLPERACKGCQAFLPRDDGTLSAIQLPLLGKEPLLQLDGHCMRRRRSHANQQAKVSITIKKQAQANTGAE
jgi:hypothetical protein